MSAKGIASFVDAHGGVNAESLAFSPDCKWLASGGSDGTFKLWDLGAGSEHFHHRGTGIVTSIAFRPDGKQLAWCSCREAIVLWDFAGNTNAIKLDERLSTDCVAFGPDGNQLAACGGMFGRLAGQQNDTIVHGHLNLWETGTCTELFAVTLDRTPAGGVSFSPDGSWLALCARRSVIRCEIATGIRKELFSVRPPQVLKGAAFGPGRVPLAASAEGARLHAWNATTGQELCTLQWPAATFSCVAFGPNGELLASDSKTVMVWESATGRELHNVATGEEDDVCSVALSTDGNLLATGYVHGEVKVWSLAG